MATDVGGSQGGLRNIVARLRQRRPETVRSAQQQAPEVARLQAAMEMHELGVRLYRQRMHREHPTADRADIDHMVKAWLAEPPRSGGLRMRSRERGRGIR
jgi:Rv0078B-related antitoxin